MSALREQFIAADVGGTHVRIGLVQESSDPAHPVAVLQYRKYVCAQYPGLAEIIEDFIGTLGNTQVSHGVIASAGFPLEDAYHHARSANAWALRISAWSMTSRPWPMQPPMWTAAKWCNWPARKRHWSPAPP